MKKCPKCGYTGTSKFCPECGSEMQDFEFANSDPIESLKKLKELFDSGAITEEEFSSIKKKVIDSSNKENNSFAISVDVDDDQLPSGDNDAVDNSTTYSVSNRVTKKRSSVNNTVINIGEEFTKHPSTFSGTHLLKSI